MKYAETLHSTAISNGSINTGKADIINPLEKLTKLVDWLLIY